MLYAITLSLTLTLCFAAQALALRASGGRFAKSESNFFSSISRIQAGIRGEPEIMILGSSITGRLPDRAQGFAGVANMGCDGGSAADTIRAIDEGLLPAAPVIIVEANALQVAFQGDSEIARTMRKPWFRIGTMIPALSAYARPAACLYSPLLARRTGDFGTPDGDDLGDGSSPTRAPDSWKALEVSGRERDISNELAVRIANLRSRGSRVVVVWLPPGRDDDAPLPAWIRHMTATSGAEWWDLAQQALPERIALTDHVHMDAPSASRTLRSMLRGLETSSDSNGP